MERLDKFLCSCTAYTRSQIKAVLKSGRVTVDGIVGKNTWGSLLGTTIPTGSTGTTGNKELDSLILMVSRGELTPEQAKTYPGKSLITRAIGTEPVVECDLFHTVLDRGDCLLLCSDGLSNMMDDQEILFEAVHGVNKQHCCKKTAHPRAVCHSDNPFKNCPFCAILH